MTKAVKSGKIDINAKLIELVTLSEKIMAGKDKFPMITSKLLADGLLQLNRQIVETGQLPQSWMPHTNLADVFRSLPDQEDDSIPVAWEEDGKIMDPIDELFQFLSSPSPKLK